MCRVVVLCSWQDFRIQELCVHFCVTASLSQAGTLIVCYMMKHYRFTAVNV